MLTSWSPQQHIVFLCSSSERTLEKHLTTLYIWVIYTRNTLYVLWKNMGLYVKSMWGFVHNSLAHPRKGKHPVTKVIWNSSSFPETTVFDALETDNMRKCLLQTSYMEWKKMFRKKQYSVPTFSLKHWIFLWYNKYVCFQLCLQMKKKRTF